MRRLPIQSASSSVVLDQPGLEERAVARFPIIGKLRKIGKSVPKTSWDRLPRDLSANLDHYIYGVPKK